MDPAWEGWARREATIPGRVAHRKVVLLGAMPVGHTLVKGVNLASGHLVREAVEVEVPGRGPGLLLARHYSSQGAAVGAMGRGWSHTYQGALLGSPPGKEGTRSYVLVGGGGAGQQFRCQEGKPECVAQRGYHGRLRREGGTSWLYRTKGGTEYRYGAEETTPEGVRHRLLSIRSPEGQEVVLEYGGEESNGELAKVYEPGHHRFLRFSYAKQKGLSGARLTRVRLMENPQAPEPARGEGNPLGVCVGYSYNEHGELSRARRYEGDCPPEGEEGDTGLQREETYAYMNSEVEGLRDNLVSVTDANGRRTRYEYHGWWDGVPGETKHPGFGPRAERVKRVVEPEGAVTTFEYNLEPRRVSIQGQEMKVYETRVSGPRPWIPATVYRLNGYGSVVEEERPVAPGLAAHTRRQWDNRHLLPTCVVDARGQRTEWKYDAAGNAVEQRTATGPLPSTWWRTSTTVPGGEWG